MALESSFFTTYLRNLVQTALSTQEPPAVPFGTAPALHAGVSRSGLADSVCFLVAKYCLCFGTSYRTTLVLDSIGKYSCDLGGLLVFISILL